MADDIIPPTTDIDIPEDPSASDAPAPVGTPETGTEFTSGAARFVNGAENLMARSGMSPGGEGNLTPQEQEKKRREARAREQATFQASQPQRDKGKIRADINALNLIIVDLTAQHNAFMNDMNDLWSGFNNAKLQIESIGDTLEKINESIKKMVDAFPDEAQAHIQKIMEANDPPRIIIHSQSLGQIEDVSTKVGSSSSLSFGDPDEQSDGGLSSSAPTRFFIVHKDSNNDYFIRYQNGEIYHLKDLHEAERNKIMAQIHAQEKVVDKEGKPVFQFGDDDDQTRNIEALLSEWTDIESQTGITGKIPPGTYDQIMSARVERITLSHNLEEAKEELARLEKDMRILQEKIDALNGRIDGFQQQKRELEKELRELEAEERKVTTKLDDIEERAKALYDGYQARIDDLNEKLKDIDPELAAKIDDQSENLNNLSAKIFQTSGENREVETKLNESDTNRTALRDRLEQLAQNGDPDAQALSDALNLRHETSKELVTIVDNEGRHHPVYQVDDESYYTRDQDGNKVPVTEKDDLFTIERQIKSGENLASDRPDIAERFEIAQNKLYELAAKGNIIAAYCLREINLGRVLRDEVEKIETKSLNLAAQIKELNEEYNNQNFSSTQDPKAIAMLENIAELRGKQSALCEELMTAQGNRNEFVADSKRIKNFILNSGHETQEEMLANMPEEMKALLIPQEEEQPDYVTVSQARSMAGLDGGKTVGTPVTPTFNGSTGTLYAETGGPKTGHGHDPGAHQGLQNDKTGLGAGNSAS